MPQILTLLLRSVLWASAIAPLFSCGIYMFYRQARARGTRYAACFWAFHALLFAIPLLWLAPDKQQVVLFVVSLVVALFLYTPSISLLSRAPLRFVLYCAFCGINAAAGMGLSVILLHYNAVSVPPYLLMGGQALLSLSLSYLCVATLRTHVLPYADCLVSLKIRYFDITPAVYLTIMMLLYSGITVEGYLGAKLCICGLCLAGTFGAYSLSGRVFFQRMHNMRFQQRSEYLEHCIQLQQAQYAALGRQIEQARAAKHDLRHHMRVLEQYIRDGDRDRLYGYLPHLSSQIAQMHDEPCICSNSVVDVITRHYLHLAQQEGTRLDIRLNVAEDFAIPGFDLCIVIGNYLENAVEAVRGTEPEKRFIRLRADQTNDMFTLVAENNYQGERLIENGVFRSTKHYGEEGMGLSSIRAIVDKYAGNCTLAAENNVFKISLILFAQKD